MKPADQLVLDIVSPPSWAVEDYIPGPANSDARQLCEALKWPTPVGVLIGDAGSGKTHLAHLCAARFNAPFWLDPQEEALLPAASDLLVIDGLERWIGIDEDRLFHALEAARAAQVPVLSCSRSAPENIGLNRPDTVSRLRSGLRAEITLPDDALFKAIAIKLFTDRQLLVAPNIAEYLLARMERSYTNLARLIALIDERSLAAGRSITKPLAGEVLQAYELS
ncbi:MAG: DnaA regulatory inactivator HdaA [Hyphomicrobiales bacterium]